MTRLAPNSQPRTRAVCATTACASSRRARERAAASAHAGVGLGRRRPRPATARHRQRYSCATSSAPTMTGTHTWTSTRWRWRSPRCPARRARALPQYVGADNVAEDRRGCRPRRRGRDPGRRRSMCVSHARPSTSQPKLSARPSGRWRSARADPRSGERRCETDGARGAAVRGRGRVGPRTQARCPA